MVSNTPVGYIPQKQIYHNIFSKKKFKDVLTFCCEYKIAQNSHLVEQMLLGALSATELDCIADLENKVLNANQTKEHYKQYIQIAIKVMKETESDKEEVHSFIYRMEKLCEVG